VAGRRLAFGTLFAGSGCGIQRRNGGSVPTARGRRNRQSAANRLTVKERSNHLAMPMNDNISRAVRGRSVLQLEYQGAIWKVEPYAQAHDSQGVEVLRELSLAKNEALFDFNVLGICKLTRLKETFKEPRGGYSREGLREANWTVYEALD
jgi:hypothetical protein